MDFELDEEQTMLRDLVSRFAADHCGLAERAAHRGEAEGFSRANWRLLGELGLLAMPFAEEHGGLGGGAVEIMTVAEQLGRGLCTEPYLTDLLLAARLLERAGTPSQRKAWLPRIMAGETRIALAHFEHQARFNPLYVRCDARATGTSEGKLIGAKTLVLSGAGVDGYIVSAREGGAPDVVDGLSLWFVAVDAPGIERHAYRVTDGSMACELRFHGTPAERLEGGSAELLAVFDEARIAACAEMVGIMATLFDATLEHVRTRQQFGQTIGSFQAVQHRMADLYVLLEQSRSHILRAALSLDDGVRSIAIAAAKSFVSASAVRLGEECIQFHGGMGTTDELAIGHGHKRILLLASLLGDADSELARYAAMVA